MRRLVGIRSELETLWSAIGNTAVWDADPTYYRDRCFRAFESFRAAVEQDWTGYVPRLEEITRTQIDPVFVGSHESAGYRQTLLSYRTLATEISHGQPRPLNRSLAVLPGFAVNGKVSACLGCAGVG